jgi:hypothetical protein
VIGNTICLTLKDLATYRSLRDRIRKKVEQFVVNPYAGTERLGHLARGINLEGCRGAHVGQNFRIIFFAKNVAENPSVSTATAKACPIRQLSF